MGMKRGRHSIALTDACSQARVQAVVCDGSRSPWSGPGGSQGNSQRLNDQTDFPGGTSGREPVC